MSEMLLGERGESYRGQITGRRTYSMGRIAKVSPVGRGMLAGRALITIALDSFDFGFMAYGPLASRVGDRAEVYEFQLYGSKWLVDWLPLPPAPRQS